MKRRKAIIPAFSHIVPDIQNHTIHEENMTIDPEEYHLNVIQGATFQKVITWKDENGVAINLTGYTARMQARVEYESAAPFINLTTENGGITLGGAAGTITLSISATATAAITQERGYWDIELISGSGIVYRLLQGNVSVSKEVTK